MPELALKCIQSWHKFMPDYDYVLWDEDSFDVNSIPYTKEAYEVGRFAFVSDVVRLKALKEEGGIYFDVDFEVYKPFDNGARFIPLKVAAPDKLDVKDIITVISASLNRSI